MNSQIKLIRKGIQDVEPLYHKICGKVLGCTETSYANMNIPKFVSDDIPPDAYENDIIDTQHDEEFGGAEL